MKIKDTKYLDFFSNMLLHMNWVYVSGKNKKENKNKQAKRKEKKQH
jgi:hypothetical protein